jgi:hypothetical protein
VENGQLNKMLNLFYLWKNIGKLFKVNHINYFGRSIKKWLNLLELEILDNANLTIKNLLLILALSQIFLPFSRPTNTLRSSLNNNQEISKKAQIKVHRTS